MEREEEVAEPGVHSTNSTALGIVRGTGGFEFQLNQLAGSPRMSCYLSLSLCQKSLESKMFKGDHDRSLCDSAGLVRKLA